MKTLLMLLLFLSSCTTRKELRSTIDAYKAADSLNRIRYDQGQSFGWYQVNPFLNEKK